MNLDAYLARIGWQGRFGHDLITLTALLRAHMRHIPFENLDVLLGRPIRIDLDGVQQQLVAQRRGGYCFQHATLFAAALEALGFAPVRHIARVTLFVPRERAARTHMFLSVPLPEGRFVVDPGFGAQAARLPLPLHSGAEVHLDDDTHAMVCEPDGRLWAMRAQLGTAERGQPRDPPIDGWVSTMEAEPLVDFEMGHHYTATHPQSTFRHHLMLRALTDDGRVTVMNRQATVWRRGQPPERFLLADRAALGALLAEHFGIELPEVETLRVPSVPEWGPPGAMG